MNTASETLLPFASSPSPPQSSNVGWGEEPAPTSAMMVSACSTLTRASACQNRVTFNTGGVLGFLRHPNLPGLRPRSMTKTRREADRAGRLGASRQCGISMRRGPADGLPAGGGTGDPAEIVAWSCASAVPLRRPSPATRRTTTEPAQGPGITAQLSMRPFADRPRV
jgi:hypothetical protein